MPSDRSVSIIIPVHNGADFIGTALRSVERQLDSLKNLEVVIIDDGSTDETMEIAAAFTNRLDTVVEIRNSEAVGIGSARIQGLAAATGEYIAFLDADDWIAPGRLAHLVTRSEELGVDFLRTDHVKAFENGDPRRIDRAPGGRRNVVLHTRESILPVTASTMIDYPFPWAGIFHRRLVDDGRLAYDEGLHSFEDRVALWRLALGGATFAVVDAPWIFYRREVTTSLTQVFDARQLAFLEGFELIWEMIAQDPDREAFEAKLIRQFLAISAHHVVRSDGMSRPIRQKLYNAIADFAQKLDYDVLEEQWRGIGFERRERLARSVLPVIRRGAPA